MLAGANSQNVGRPVTLTEVPTITMTEEATPTVSLIDQVQPIVAEQRSWVDYWWILAIVVVLGFAFWFFRRLRSTKK